VALVLGATIVVSGLARRARRRRHDDLPSVSYPKVFVVGCPRSGTTWVADILGRHPAVIRGRESQLYSTIRRSLGDLGAYNPIAWARLLYGVERGARRGAMAGIHLYVDRATLARLGRAVVADAPARAEVPARLVRAVLDTYFVQAGGRNGRVLVEKTPAHVHYIDEILGTFPEAHVVDVLRDGRDVCVSMALRSARVSAFPATPEGRIRMWMRAVEAGSAAARDPRWHGRVTIVRYESLKADPEGEIRRLYTAVGLEASDELVAEVAHASDIARFPTGPGEFRHRGEVGTWADHLSAEDEALFRALAGDLFLASGYSY
jgi:hypothetical protein